MDILQQLEAGIRYFDLRVAPKQVTGADGVVRQQLWIVHGLYSVPLKEVIRSFAYFLHEHDFEVVILDFQHFYKMTPELHLKVAKKLKKHLGAILIPNSVDLTLTEFRRLAADQHRVVVVYGRDWQGSGNDRAIQANDFLRPSEHCLHSPWPNTMSRSVLKDYLQKNLSQRSPTHLHCTQLVLTPQKATAVAMKSLRDIATRVNQQVHLWIVEWYQQNLHGNIMMIDHVETCPEFVPTLIKINYERGLLTKRDSIITEQSRASSSSSDGPTVERSDESQSSSS